MITRTPNRPTHDYTSYEAHRAASVAAAHAEEHARCEELGEGACVPVKCSCGESWNFLPNGAPDWSVMGS